MADDAPSRDDGVTTGRNCAACDRPFEPSGRRRHCSDACRQKAWRRRHGAEVPEVPVPKGRKREMTVYECDGCGARELGIFSSPSGRETMTSARSAKSCKGFWGRRRKLDVGYRCIARKPMTTDWAHGG